MLTKEQLADRLNFCTGSDAATICGLSPYKSAVQLWLEKTQRAEQDDISEANYIKFGNYMEDGVAKWFEAESGKKVYKEPAMLVHPEHSWMAGNIDFKIEDENAILECKTAMRTDGWGEGENIFPEHYLMQVAHYCAVGGFDTAYIAVVFTMTREMRWYQYDRNVQLEQKLIKLESDFWHNHVLADVAPELETENDVMAMFKVSASKPITATDEIEAYVYAYKDFDSQIAGLAQEKEYMRDKIAVFMKDNDLLTNAAGQPLVSWKYSKQPISFDKDRFKKEHPELYKQYNTKLGNASRPFKVNKKGDN